jgi:hypothetical protein
LSLWVSYTWILASLLQRHNILIYVFFNLFC